MNISHLKPPGNSSPHCFRGGKSEPSLPSIEATVINSASNRIYIRPSIVNNTSYCVIQGIGKLSNVPHPKQKP